MQLSFRWYGADDPVSLQYIRQIPGMAGIVTAIYDVPVGQVWPMARILQLKEEIEKAGLVLETIESVPVHEDIKLGRSTRETYIQNYQETIRNLGQAGIKTICYNFMPVFDWTRTQLDKQAPDGSTSLVMYMEQLQKLDPLKDGLSLPGWDSSYEKSEMRELFAAYDKVGEDGLWENLAYFLKAVIPVAEQAGIRMAIHPDDPPQPIFGLPRIVTNQKNLDRLLAIIDSPANSLTLCTGSLGASQENDIPALVRRYSGMNRIGFMHLRNIKLFPDNSFEETAHLSSCGSLDMYAIVKALTDTGFDGPVRPDHGRMIWGEQGRPGYGLFDRALGATYINGLFEACEKAGK